MSETSLIPVENLPIQKFSDEVFKQLASSSFLPRVCVCDSNSQIVKKKQASLGNIAFQRGQETIDLGESVDFIVVAWQPKAMRFGDSIIASIDINSETFKKIQLDSETPNSGCMYGFEFLIWLKDLKEFATYFMGSKTARREAPQLKKLIGQAATLKTTYIEKGKFSWYGPVVLPCSAPFDSIPDEVKIKEAAVKFSKVEEVEIAAETRER